MAVALVGSELIAYFKNSNKQEVAVETVQTRSGGFSNELKK